MVASIGEPCQPVARIFFRCAAGALTPRYFVGESIARGA
jgi:hypothetical protein